MMPLLDAGVDKWPVGKYTLYKQDTQNYSVDNARLFFEVNYIFVDNFNTSSWS